MNRFLFPVVLLIAVGCADKTERDGAPDRLVQDCALPPEGDVTWFDSSGSLHWTADALDEEGSMTVRYCDGSIARAVRITGLTAGESIDWQEGAMTDGSRRVINIGDITVISTVPVASPRLEGVTVQCIPLLGSCTAAPEPVVEVAPEVGETTRTEQLPR